MQDIYVGRDCLQEIWQDGSFFLVSMGQNVYLFGGICFGSMKMF